VCGGGVIAWVDGRTIILVDDALGLEERRVALAHELVHDERGGPLPSDVDQVLVAREERRVDDEVARRLAPADELFAVAFRADELGVGVEAWEVAEQLGVTTDVIERAVRLIGDGETS
jgi:hypothetical protein